jgi:hypothetical protein
MRPGLERKREKLMENASRRLAEGIFWLAKRIFRWE